MNYYGYRYYAADAGRWINRDPIKEKGGWNLYGMIGNDALAKYDLLGMTPSTEWELKQDNEPNWGTIPSSETPGPCADKATTTETGNEVTISVKDSDPVYQKTKFDSAVEKEWSTGFFAYYIYKTKADSYLVDSHMVTYRQDTLECKCGDKTYKWHETTMINSISNPRGEFTKVYWQYNDWTFNYDQAIDIAKSLAAAGK